MMSKAGSGLWFSWEQTRLANWTPSKRYDPMHKGAAVARGGNSPLKLPGTAPSVVRSAALVMVTVPTSRLDVWTGFELSALLLVSVVAGPS